MEDRNDKERSRLKNKKVMFSQDNDPHVSIAMAKIHELKFVLINLSTVIIRFDPSIHFCFLISIVDLGPPIYLTHLSTVFIRFGPSIHFCFLSSIVDLGSHLSIYSPIHCIHQIWSFNTFQLPEFNISH